MRSKRLPAAGNQGPRRTRTLWIGVVAASAAIALAPMAGNSLLQNTIPRIPPEMTRAPDANQANDINAAKARKRNFDAANAIRAKAIADDTTKLLILTRDLKAQTDKLGDTPLPPRLVREAEVIEILAHDVEAKMKLTVGGS